MAGFQCGGVCDGAGNLRNTASGRRGEGAAENFHVNKLVNSCTTGSDQVLCVFVLQCRGEMWWSALCVCVAG